MSQSRALNDSYRKLGKIYPRPAQSGEQKEVGRSLYRYSTLHLSCKVPREVSLLPIPVATSLVQALLLEGFLTPVCAHIATTETPDSPA